MNKKIIYFFAIFSPIFLEAQPIVERVKLYSNPAICNIDKSKMIPIRDGTHRRNQFVAKLTGNSINGDIPYEIHFDTGSWSTSIPYAVIDKSQIKVLKKDVEDDWGNLADKVSGQLTLKSLDGTSYTVDNYVFFALKNKDGTDMPDDRGKAYSNGSIMGAFPSEDPHNGLYSLPYAIAKKYSAKKNMGLGIVSDCMCDIEKDWNSLKSYLQIGSNPEITKDLKWRKDIPLWHSHLKFCPEALPGFKVTIQFPHTDKSIGVEDLIATVDTGAPDLTLKLGRNDPQNEAIFANHFEKTDHGKIGIYQHTTNMPQRLGTPLSQLNLLIVKEIRLIILIKYLMI